MFDQLCIGVQADCLLLWLKESSCAKCLICCFFYFLGDKSLLVLSAECRRIHTLYIEPKWLATMIMISINQTISIENRKIYNSLRNKNIFYQKKEIRIFYHVKFSNKMIIYRSHNAVPSIRWTVLRWILSYESAGFKKMAL